MTSLDSEAIGYTPAQAAAEVIRRRRARQSLIAYAEAIEIPGDPIGKEDDSTLDIAHKPIGSSVALHHKVMMQAMQECVEDPRGGRLIILAPPGSAKSTYAGPVTVSWCMGRKPDTRYIIASYATGIAAKQSRKARGVVRQERYTSIWPERPILAADQRAIDEWALSNGSELMAAGLLAGITGNRANGIVVDDPVANREDADSATMQEKTYNEFMDTVNTRLKPNGWVILIQTRWNENDLAGSILPENYNGESGRILCRDGKIWNVVCIAAEAEREDDILGRRPRYTDDEGVEHEGEFLWPEYFPRHHWDTWRANPRARRTWSSLFQQRPAPEAGIQFSRAMFKWYDPDKPHGTNARDDDAVGTEREPGVRAKYLRMYGASDVATKEDGGDYTEHGAAGMDQYGDLYITDWYYSQVETDKWIAKWIAMLKMLKARKEPAIRWADEGGLIDRAVGPAKRRAMREAKTYVAVESMPSISNKSVKLSSFHARAAARTVWLPTKREWAQRLVTQLCGFPAAKHDDGPDVCGLLGRLVDQMAEAALPPREKPREIIKPFTEKWFEKLPADQEKPKVRWE